MDHETEVATGRGPADPEVDERIAAFKRGAPLPKTAAKSRSKAATRTNQRAVPKQEAPAEAEATSEPSRDEPDERPSSSGDARRRRRGGRGRGGRGGTPSGITEGGDPEQVEPAATGASRAPKTASTSSSDDTPKRASSSDAQPSSSAPSATRKRRRRGGRGRGRGGGGTDAARAEQLADGGLDESPQPQTPGSQRDDATPDTPTTTPTPTTKGSSRRSRSRGGSGAPKPSGNGRSTGTKQRSRADASTQMSVEEQVAAGGPTRGIRGGRTRTGRAGRRRRETAIVPPRITDKLMVITEHGERDQIAVLEEDVLVQHYVTRQGATSMVGNVYLGRVQNVLPGMEAAFIDIGRGRNGVLYAGEVNYRPEDLEGPAPRIENVLKSGQAVTVQVTKDPMGGKGARLTAQISLPGRYLVLAPDQDLSGISRRLPDTERRRLKSILKKVQPSGHGVIVRTAAEGASEEAIVHDLQRLIALWDGIEKQTKKVKAPAVLYEEPELTLRVFRDLFTDEEFRGLVTDSQRIHERVLEYVRDIAPDLEPKVTLHEGKLPAFEEHRIEEQIHKALDRKVWLPSGGYLVIERTEAMTIVDVNTGKSVGKTNLEETVVNTNLEAAKEVARQLRLRDIGGIIVVDFIDMLLEDNKGKVEETMKEAMALDKTRSQVFEIGPLGLMQVTRKRVSSGLVESFSETCPTCEGRGIIVNYGS
ncbi:MAG TPA: Rne/Rng family ribonuclease [Actinomycetota bacterium]|nr:Rne/Rng family ribonuclease [Actinomycetota bacterium]